MPSNRSSSAYVVLTLALCLEMPVSFAADGASVFSEECADCHSVTSGKNKKGPSLFGVVGRTPGSIAGFNYSEAMRANHTAWSKSRLNAYISAPKKIVPGGKMKYDGLSDAGSREALIDYLAEQN
ncbi:cytochrome c [Gammaproteobacteria bacterium]